MKNKMEIRIDAIFANRPGEREMKDSDPQANHEEAGGVLEDFKTALQVPGQSSTARGEDKNPICGKCQLSGNIAFIGKEGGLTPLPRQIKLDGGLVMLGA